MEHSEVFKNQFKELLRTRIKKKKDWVNELAELLDCSTDAIYKKNRASNFYTLDEVLCLAQHYSISLDLLLFENKGEIIFKSPYLIQPVKTIDDYLNRLKLTFNNLEYFKNTRIYYATRELPIFYYFLNQELAQFKLYVFARNIWKLSPYANSKFSFQMFPTDLFERLTVLWQKYSSLTRFEYWNTNILDSTLQQINYYYESGELDHPSASRILDGIELVLNKIKQLVFTDKKSEDSKNFFLFENKILHTSNHILVKSQEKNILYLTFDNPNFIISEDQEFTDYAEKWYDTIHESSYAVGQGSGHHALNFFNQMQFKLDQVRKKWEHTNGSEI